MTRIKVKSAKIRIGNEVLNPRSFTGFISTSQKFEPYFASFIFAKFNLAKINPINATKTKIGAEEQRS